MSQQETNEQSAFREWLMSTLNANNQRPFVRRILFPDTAPVSVDDEDPSQVMTHKMAWAEADGKYYVYPTVMEDAGELRNYGDAAFDEALKRRDYITFDNPEDAERFTKGYKTYWDDIGYMPEIKK